MQNLIDVFCTLLRRDFPRPELFDAVHQLLFVAWLDFRLQKELEFVPQVLDWVQIRAFCRRLPPVDTFLLKEGLCSVRSMLGVIVLHKTMIGQLLSNERDQGSF